MKKRLITGILYIGVIVGFFFLRNIHPWFFGILVYAFSLIGTYEMVHAFSYRKVKEDGTEEPPAFEMALSQKIAVFAFAALFTPVYYLVEWLAGEGVGYRGMLILAFVFALALLCLLVFDHKRCSLQGAGGAMLCAFYPTVLLATMLLANDLAAGTLALLIIFVISPVADTFAFVVGSIFKGKKLCPNISPNKTVSGAVGGIVFGTGASVLLYWLYTLCSDYVYTGLGSGYAWAPWVIFAAIGLIASVMTEFGDLAESIIKRKVGVKDMGKLLPGHGGILDRIDGTLLASTFVYIVFEIFVLL